MRCRDCLEVKTMTKEPKGELDKMNWEDILKADKEKTLINKLKTWLKKQEKP